MLIVFTVVDKLVLFGASGVMVACKPVEFYADSLRSEFKSQLAPSSRADFKRGGKENESTNE